MSAPSPRWARAAWARVAEPTNETVAGWIGEYGPGEAWQRLVAGELPVPQRLAAIAAGLDPADEARRCTEAGARFVIPGDDEWPAGLDDLEHRPSAHGGVPLGLWVRGGRDLAEAVERSVALVGSRASTAYGSGQARQLAAELADRGWSVVSGAAYGIDGAAHEGALAAEGVTVAVLAGGVDRPQPAGHERLVARIAETGLVVSEAPPGRTVRGRHFLQRNRIVAALAGATVVVEAGLRSGARGTASAAERLGRPVGALPGPVTSMASAGCHDLVRSGQAVLVTNAAEVVELASPLGEVDAATVEPPEIDPLAASVLAALDGVTVDTGQLGTITGLAPLDLLVRLGALEAAGLVDRDGDLWTARAG